MALKISSGGDGADESAPKQITSGSVSVKDRYEIKLDEPLPDYDTAPALAYRAVSIRDPSRPLHALVCDPKLPPRLDMISALHRVEGGSMVQVSDWDVVDWPPEGRRCPVLILNRPGGKKVLSGLTDKRKPLSEDFVTKHLIHPAVEILREMHGVGETHRALRPDNIYFSSEDEKGLVIGECFSAPPAMTQPLVVETLDSCLSLPGGRGEGLPGNDLYSLGVCILSLLIGQYPCNQMNDEEVIQQKMAVGSYSAIAQNHRVSLTIMEVLRGLLNDEETDRWTIEDLALWLNGRRLSPKLQALPAKATRPITVGGQGFNTARELAVGLHKNWDEAIPLVREGEIDGWLRRSLGDESRTEAMAAAKSAAGNDEPDRLVARAIIALDPNGPIRLRGLSATVGGLGMFCSVYRDDAEAQRLFSHVIHMGLATFWLEQQFHPRAESAHSVARLDRMRATLMRPTLGFGMERVMYELNSDMPCRSPLFEKDYVATLDHVLPALDRAAREREGDIKRLIDRDIAAYISVHFRRSVAGDLSDLEGEDHAAAAIAQVRMLAVLQDSVASGKPLPDLSRAAVKLLQPSIEEFQSRTTRKRITQTMLKVGKEGRLQGLVNVIANPAEIDADKAGYLKATNDFTKSAVEMINLRRNIKNQATVAATVGGQFSSGIAGILAALVCLITAAIRLA
ncbi:hypothetical protein EOI86_24055 [Hwanghaeella grinnelliae]|uniref:Protein kinase domain-containing protein n=1 Tax=Hwanghaeella grinnelliae TaxID=2500179 RepID=A0A437QI18_9PROT|nr:hypothetical protein [Hwanghaeella grinnelliae]RVU34187.1 hypothetical protein EOI86_24055 [Hwanghaeella grinnelliae]